MINNKSKITIFENQKVRRIWYKKEWYYSIIDVVKILSRSSRPKKYWSDLKNKMVNEDGFGQPSDFFGRLKMIASDGKRRETDCANLKTIFRIIQSIPSPNAEPFKMWLAQVGKERIDEINDPELAQKRMKALYRAKGYPDSWIEKRVRGIAIREELTDEWKKREVGEDREYAILTAEISKATFGMTPSEYRKFKGLKRENLRDHMDDLELIFTMLGEASTTEIAKTKNAQGFEKNKTASKKGGKIAGDARKKLEIETGKKVSKKDNYLNLINDKKNKDIEEK